MLIPTLSAALLKNKKNPSVFGGVHSNIFEKLGNAAEFSAVVGFFIYRRKYK